MNDSMKQAAAFGIAGIVTTLSAVNAVLDEKDLVDISDGQWVKIVSGGVIAALVGWKTLLAKQPESKKQ